MMAFTRQLFRKMSDDILKKQNNVLNLAWKYTELPKSKKRLSKKNLVELNAHVVYELQRRGLEFDLAMELNRLSLDMLAAHTCETCDCGLCTYKENSAATTSAAFGAGVNRALADAPASSTVNKDGCPDGQVKIGTEDCFDISQ